MTQKRFWTLFLLIISICFDSYGQDPQYSQFYANQLYLNPGFAGSTGGGRFGASYRNQWPQLEANYITYAFAFDYHFEDYRSSVGLIVKHDEQGSGTVPFKKTDFGLIYSYMIPINETTVIQPGLQVSYAIKSLNFNGLLFPDQFNDNGPLGSPTAEEFPTNQIQYVDISAGAVMISNNSWLGVSAHHLNQPNESFFDKESKLPMKLSVHGGYRFSFENYYDDLDKSITPAVIYEKQGGSQRLSVGTYAIFEPLVFGVWYKGIPIQKLENQVANNDALAFVGGLKFKGWNVAYSYDLTLSGLSRYNASSHEVSLVFHFGSENIHCPDPWGTSKRRRSFRR